MQAFSLKVIARIHTDSTLQKEYIICVCYWQLSFCLSQSREYRVRT